MFDISEAEVSGFVVHRVGNKLRGESNVLSQKKVEKTERIDSILLRNYLGGTLKSESEFLFFHESDIKFNEVRAFAKEIFESPSEFVSSSKKIAQHLYSVSAHPNISGGDVFVILFDRVVAYGRSQKALGVFKTEIKDTYLRLENYADRLSVVDEDGVNPDRLQKGAIIFEESECLIAVDNQTQQSRLWFDDFLKVKPLATGARAASLASAIYKSTVASIDEIQSLARYKMEVLEATEGRTSSLADMVALSGRYIGSEGATRTAEQAAASLDVQYDPEAEISNKRLARLIQSTVRKVNVCEGIDLVVNSKSRLNSIKKTQSNDSIVLVIELDKKEK